MILQNDFKAQWTATRVQVEEAVREVGESGWLILGRQVEKFEESLPDWFGYTYAVGCGNGMDALEIALRATGIRAGDKVLTTPLSAFASTLAILRAGGHPVYTDVDQQGLLDLDQVEAALEADRDIRFFLPVHLYGFALDQQRLERIKERFHPVMIEDCAQAIGARSHGKLLGTAAEAGATSFYPTKNLGAMGDGGAFLTGSVELAETARCLRDYGQSAKYVHSRQGLNSRLDELQAAILNRALLPLLREHQQKRAGTAARYLAGITHPALRLPVIPETMVPAWHLFPVFVSEDRERFIKHMADQGVQCGIHYPGLIPFQPAMERHAWSACSPLQQAKQLADSEVSLPIHPYLKDAEIAQVIAACNSW